MKGLYCCFFLLGILSFAASGQTPGEYRSNVAAGNWNVATSWQTYNGSAWVAAATPPTGTEPLITIQSGHNITMPTGSSTFTITTRLDILPNGTLTIAIAPVPTLTRLTLSNTGVINNFGMINFTGTGTKQIGAAVDGTINNSGFIKSSSSKLLFNASSNYKHILVDSAGTIPSASWHSTSNCIITSSHNLAPVGLSQPFGNFEWNYPTQSTFIDLGGLLTSVTGDLRLVTNQFNGVTLNGSANPYSLTVGGSIICNEYFEFNSGSGVTTINVTGNLEVDDPGGNAYMVLVSGTGSTVLTITGDLLIENTGGVDMSLGANGSSTINLSGNYTTQSGGFLTAGSGTGQYDLNFVGTALQTVTETQMLDGIDISIPNSGSIVSIPNGAGNNFLGTNGNFSLGQGATLLVGSVAAGGAIQVGTANGNLRVGGIRTFASGSTIIYNGTAAQFIGSGHPGSTRINTTINNSAGVTVASNATIGGLLYLQSGNLSLGDKLLTLNDEFLVNAPYALDVTSSSSIYIGVGDAGPFGTLVTTGSTSINNLTLERSGQTVSVGGDLTITGTLTHDATINFPGFTFNIQGPYVTTGGSLVGNENSTLIISGSGSITGAISLDGTLGVLEVNRPVGITNTTNVNIATDLRILSGTYQGAGTVTILPGAKITRKDGAITKALSVTDYNLEYISTGVTVTGSELVTSPSTALNNLTINSGNSITLNPAITSITVNGSLLLSGGQFISAGKGIFLKGDLISNGTGTFTGSLVTFAGNTTISGADDLTLDDVEIQPVATLNLGNNTTIRFSGNIDSDNGGTWIAGTSSVFFEGNTTILINETNVPRFNNVTIDPSSTLVIDCSSCGSENSRPYIEVAGNWNSNNIGAVFTPAPNVASNEVTAVQLTGVNQSINMISTQPFWDLYLAGSGTVTLGQTLRTANDLKLGGTKTLSTGSNHGIQVGGDFLLDGGSFTANQGTVTFNGTSVQTVDRLSGTGPVTFFNLNVNKAGGTFRVAMNVNLRNVFTLSSNTTVDFDGTAGADVFTLLSTSSRTASIAPILSPAIPSNVQGNITVQRYMDGEGRIYRYLSSPVANAQAIDVQREIAVTGSFTGSSYPPQTGCVGCAPCTGCSSNNQSMHWLDETLTGRSINFRYVDFPAVANTETLRPGRGYAVFVREATAPTTLDLRGTANTGDQPLIVSYSGTSIYDGWNLVGNPYPSPIDWQLADGPTSWTRDDVDATIYTWDESINDYATYNRTTSSAVNGGTRYVATGQGFWVRTLGDLPVLTAREGVKASQQPTFFREAAPADYVRMTLQGNEGQRDETLIHFNIEGASDQYDLAIDSYKFPDSTFNFYTLTTDHRALAINALGEMGCSKAINIGLSGVSVGHYSIAFSEYETFTEPVNIYLMDNFTGESFTLSSTDRQYDFEVTEAPESFGEARFKIIFGRTKVETDLTIMTDPVCTGTDAKIELLTTQRDITYFATINGTTISDPLVGNGESQMLSIPNDKINPGMNTVVIMAQSPFCLPIPLKNSVKVNVEKYYDVSGIKDGTICNSGAVTLSVDGAPSGGGYRWYEALDSTEPIAGEFKSQFTTPVLQKSKTYFVSIVNSLGCEGPRAEVKAEVTPFTDAKILADGTVLASNYDTGNQWFLDGEAITGAIEKEYKPTRSGYYELTVKGSQGCISTFGLTYEMPVTEIYPNPVTDVINVSIPSDNPVKATLYNNLGVQLGILELKQTGQGRMSGQIDMEGYAAGIYFIEIQEGKKMQRQMVLKK